MSGMDPRQRMDPRLIKEISNEIGSELRMLGIYLGFTMAQLERLRDAYRNMGDQIFAMLNAWHDVVVLCGENPRHLLAAALQDCENSNLAVTKLVTPKELDELKPKERNPREETKRQIEQINFSVPGVSRSSSADSLPSNPKYGQLKKPFDDAIDGNMMSQRMMGIYLKQMESVGAIIAHSHAFGTGFKVGSNYIMTTWNVITCILDPSKTGHLQEQKLQEVFISFSDPPLVSDISTYKFQRIAWYNENLDIAILEISNPDQRLPFKLRLWKEDIPLTQNLSLIGYGHPLNLGKYFEYRCPIVYQQNQASLSAYVQQNRQDIINHLDVNFVKSMQSKGTNPEAVVDLGYRVPDYTLLIHCFMEHGASGSPILACLNPAAGIVEVVGVLTHGIPEFFFCLNDEGKKYMLEKQLRFEAGSRMKLIFQYLCSENPVLAQDIFS